MFDGGDSDLCWENSVEDMIGEVLEIISSAATWVEVKLTGVLLDC